MIRKREPVAWTQNESLSGWTWFGAQAPNGLALPAAMDGARLVFLAAETGANGNADANNAQVLVDFEGSRVGLAVVAGSRVVFRPEVLQNQGWIALRSVQADGTTAVVQTAARTAHWLFQAEG